MSVPVLPLADTESEGTESVTLRVEPHSYYAVGANAQASVSIADALPSP